MNKYVPVILIGLILAILGILFVTIFPMAFPVTKTDSFTGLTYTVPNTTFSFLGIGMIVVGGLITFFGRYLYTKEEEKEDIEKAKRE